MGLTHSCKTAYKMRVHLLYILSILVLLLIDVGLYFSPMLSTGCGDWCVVIIVGVADLVFFQNGMLEPWLRSKGLGDANQVLAYFAVSKLGEPPVDGKTDTNPQGLTAAYGNWASAVSQRLQAGGLSCKVLNYYYYY